MVGHRPRTSSRDRSEVDATSGLSEFDRIAGPLAVARWDENNNKRNTRLSDDAVAEIADHLDRAGWKVLDSLPPKDRSKLALHNQRVGKEAVKTFTALLNHPKFVIPLRWRLNNAIKTYNKTTIKATM